MKTAVCISGKMDFCRESLASLRQNILDHNDCDLFVHGYQCPQSESLALEIGSEKCLFEPPTRDFEIPDYFFHAKYHETNIESLFWMWRNIFKSVNLVAGTYDAVIRTRWDVIYPEPLRLDGAQFDTYWIPRGGDHRRGICDIFAISSQSNMKYYASLHEKLVQYVDGGVIAHPEILLKHHLLFQPDRISTVTRFDYPLHLIRGTTPRLKLHPANPVFKKI